MHGAVVVIALVPVIAAAQQFLPALPGAPVDPNTRFEVASVKAFDGTASGNVLMRMTPGQFESNMPLGVLLRQALQKPDYQIVGAPGWIETERYSILAKVPEGLPLSAVSVMLVNLLKDRFQLATHLETRELPIFHLVMARTDGRLGPDLRVTPADCQATIAERIAAAKAPPAGRGSLPPLPPLPGPNDPLPCGFSRNNRGHFIGSGRTIAQIAPLLADLVSRPVIDKTGLTGLYDYALKFAPDSAGIAGPFRTPVAGAPDPAPADPDAPSFSTALQEQLGLKLENARGPVEVLVIDKIERPTLE